MKLTKEQKEASWKRDREERQRREDEKADRVSRQHERHMRQRSCRELSFTLAIKAFLDIDLDPHSGEHLSLDQQRERLVRLIRQREGNKGR